MSLVRQSTNNNLIYVYKFHVIWYENNHIILYNYIFTRFNTLSVTIRFLTKRHMSTFKTSIDIWGYQYNICIYNKSSKTTSNYLKSSNGTVLIQEPGRNSYNGKHWNQPCETVCPGRILLVIHCWFFVHGDIQDNCELEKNKII